MSRKSTPISGALALACLCAAAASAQDKPRARDIGIPFEGRTGTWNAITDVPGIEVGQQTLISGEGKLVVGTGPVRTGVTVVWPRGKQSSDPVFAGFFSQNGNGDMTGTHWIEESGFADGPVLITNTHSVGVVRDSYLQWLVQHQRVPGTNVGNGFYYAYPIVGETFDGFLNDINGFHVKSDDVFKALDNSAPGRVPEGNVGGGTGMMCYGFKGGTGTASRKLPPEAGGYTVGVLVQCNCGSRPQLRIAGVPVGIEIPDLMPVADARHEIRADTGSIIIVIATDAPLLPHQTKRLARRATMGLARTGAISNNGSGDLFLAFSTANPGAAATMGPVNLSMASNDSLNPVFEAAIQATEEAIVNSMVAAETMTGFNNHKLYALPQTRLREILKKYNRLSSAP